VVAAFNAGGIEASDLISQSGALVHLKLKGKSSVLSHLFLQAANSCELLRRSPLPATSLASSFEPRDIRQHSSTRSARSTPRNLAARVWTWSSAFSGTGRAAPS
jgi:uncharacterized protein (TIGR04141 family)